LTSTGQQQIKKKKVVGRRKEDDEEGGHRKAVTNAKGEEDSQEKRTQTFAANLGSAYKKLGGWKNLSALRKDFTPRLKKWTRT